jgi:hypothetical protein
VPIVPVQGRCRSRLGGTHGGAGGVENACLEKVPIACYTGTSASGRRPTRTRRVGDTVKVDLVVPFHVIATI